ncbi:Bax inhibitor-1/YccA family protein [Rhodomicrobium vannielii ATCC 17100]|uniref:Bax inhibitor-1/YccA family protein n=1 Tax=Rhodomicrobium udaipurense TaxID=1202716 RepID=A0A8I1GDW5_9HYPH|nr:MULTISPECIES: Bax inhibitor-1/YccA family protein [Rhodomicrobium]KAI95640.1 membrane protein [Rhodomicrobium udaipurense JA643]MBJ7535528.1 Bax inhibitor-1/YccA family protein [Rhodomicrobium vannielii ATCC 17100]MBJ7543074.1 Bax inhibitor-1/YccA family protein [Rhodomicrobium udaipurense]
MADYDTSRAYNTSARARTDAFAIDEGLRAHMIRVYSYMGIGLLVTGIMAYTIYSQSVITNDAGKIVGLTSLGTVIFKSWVKWLVMFAPLIVVFAFSATINRMSTATAQGVFWLFAALMGLSLSSIFIAYTGTSIARIFFITAATFGAVSIYGYTTKADLTKFGSFLIMGVIGLVIASIVNAFLGSTGLQFAISVLAVLIFTGLTAYDTQQIKDNYLAQAQYGEQSLGHAAILGALSLYLDFINIFVALMQLFGERRE